MKRLILPYDDYCEICLICVENPRYSKSPHFEHYKLLPVIDIPPGIYIKTSCF